MAKSSLKRKDLKHFDWSNKAKSIAIGLANHNLRKAPKYEILEELNILVEKPLKFTKHEIWSKLAVYLEEEKATEIADSIDLLEEEAPFTVFGAELIDKSAIQQLETALRLPVSIKGALMPDAHHGYGLPIGGVLAVENAVIPYGVGMDIGCRMAMTIYDMPVSYLGGHLDQLKNVLLENTAFGLAETQSNRVIDHPIFERSEFQEIELLKQLKDKAYKQLGSSGSGNHFVEFGIAEILAFPNKWGLMPGRYVAIVSHSGSRGLGANTAKYYTDLARSKCQLPREANHLAYLSLDSDAGKEYWVAMNLAGDYAAACHDDIHRRLAKALKLEPIAKVENHHNFAWKEKVDGKELIVHRKGATPAGKGVYGIIPGSMTAPGYIVSGKGDKWSINSASHGAGRQMSRRKARNSIAKSEMKHKLIQNGVTLIGGGIDEAPNAYKDIETVMQNQNELVDVIGKFYPKIVRMDKST